MLRFVMCAGSLVALMILAQHAAPLQGKATLASLGLKRAYTLVRANSESMGVEKKLHRGRQNSQK